MLGVLIRRLERLSEGLAFAGMILLSIAIVASMIDISGRKTIGLSLYGVTDVVQLMVMSCICLSMPYTFIREGHVGVEFVTDPLPWRALVALKLLIALLICGFVAALVVYGYYQAVLQIRKGDSSLTLGIPIVWYWTPLLIGLGFSLITSVAHVLRYLVALVSGVDPLGPRSNAAEPV